MKRRFALAGAIAGSLLLLNLFVGAGCSPVMAGDVGLLLIENDRVPPPTEAAFRIAVFGDAQKGIGMFDLLMSRAAAEKPALCISTGDLVSHGDEPHWLLVGEVLRRHLADRPWEHLLIAPGNHDVRPDPAPFRRHVGPDRLDFPFGPVHIVILNNSAGPPDLDELAAALRRARSPVLIFMHVPPFDGEPRPGYEGFLDLIGRHPVPYVLSGHEHAYRRLERAGTVFIINGVGGDSDSWDLSTPGHLTMLDVSDSGVSDRLIKEDRRLRLLWEWRHLMAGHVLPFAQSPLGWLTTLALAAGTVWAWVFRMRKTQPPELKAVAST